MRPSPRPAVLLALGAALLAAPADAQPKPEHWVQIAAGRDGKEALYEVAKAAMTYPTIMQAFEDNRIQVSKHTDPRGTRLRVLIGPFAWIDATQFCDDLKALKRDCLVR